MTNVICTTLLVEKSPQALPLGAACIASAIKHNPVTEKECNVELVSFSLEDDDILNANSNSEKAALITDKILKRNPKVVCFSVFVWNRDILEEVSKNLQKKEICTLAGGPEVTAHPEALQPAFNYVTAGEGENKVPALIGKILGLKTDSPNEDKGANAITDVAGLNSPYLDGTLDVNEFGGALWELARGCPFKCSYCYESKGEKTVRQFPMERIEKELDLFAAKKIPQVFVLDPTYNANKQRAVQLLNLIAKKTPDTFYYFEARAEFIDRQMAHAFTKIPCALQIGLQSANEETLRLVNRPFNRKAFVKNIGFLNEEGVVFGLDLIFGLPAETFRTFKDGIDFAISLYPNNLEIFCLSVLPGTDLFDKAEQLHLTYEATPPYHVIHTDRFSAQDMQQSERLAMACSYFYNAGRAVPWFNTICSAVRLKPSIFLSMFADYMKKNNLDDRRKISSAVHKDIEKHQVAFVTELFKSKHQDRLIKAAVDIIRFNGALSRKIDTGKSEEISLNYPAEYVDSEYALNLDFFVNNVRIKYNKIKL